MSAPRDPGLQPERTALAWRRTLLALAVAALVSVRLLPPVLGAWSAATGLAGVLAAGVLWGAAARRSRRTRQAFEPGGAAMPGGALLVATALLTCGGAALGLLRLVAGLLR